MRATDTQGSPHDLARRVVRHATVEPDPARRGTYDTAYATWRRLYDTMDDIEVQ